MKELIVVAFILMTGIGAVGQTYTIEQEEQDSRSVRFGHRELTLAVELRNDELQLKNDGLDNEIARLQGDAENSVRIIVDRFLVEQDKAAIEIAGKLNRVWHWRSNAGLQAKLYDVEKQGFDDAQLRCRPDHAPDVSRPNFDTLGEAETACSDLHTIYLMVSRYQIKGEPVPSLFSRSSTTVGAKLLHDDTAQKKKDMESRLPAEIKNRLVSTETFLIEMDKTLWLTEITHDNVLKHNAAHPDELWADVSGVMDIVNEARQKLLTVVSEFRNSVQ
jgi:hypothetical protein